MNAREGFCVGGIVSARVCVSLKLTHVHSSLRIAIVLPGMQLYGQYITSMHLKVGVEETVCEILHTKSKLYHCHTNMHEDGDYANRCKRWISLTK